jgi:acylphosphatase
MLRQVFIKVYGRVQGVFFRSGIKTQAGLLNLTGYVKNNWDGTVEILACGEEKDLKKLIEWTKAGPPSAHRR